MDGLKAIIHKCNAPETGYWAEVPSLPGCVTQGETLEESGAVIYPYKVREGNVFVLGDNRMVSMDSRRFGEVNLHQIRGKLLLRISRGGIQHVEDKTGPEQAEEAAGAAQTTE